MKKSLFVISMILTIGLTSAFVYAETPEPVGYRAFRLSPENREIWFKERAEWQRIQIEGALKEGLITKEEAKIWNEHFTYMEKFHRENGFIGCHGMGGRIMWRHGCRW